MKIFVLAGEPSGDLHGKSLIDEFLSKNPKLEIYAVGGEKIKTTRAEIVYPLEKLKVMGFVDVFFALPRLIKSF